MAAASDTGSGRPCGTNCDPATEPVVVDLQPDEGSILDSFVQSLSQGWQTLQSSPVLLAVFWAVAAAALGYAMYVVLRRWKRDDPRTLKGVLRENLQRISVSVIAAGLAWVAADILGSAVPAFATLAALLTVQLSLGGSVRVAIETVAGTTAALVIAEVAVAEFGTGPVTVLSVVTAALIVARLLNLGQDGGVWLATTALFASALGPALNETAAVDRIAVIIVGAVIGIALSPLAHPASPLKLARHKLEELSDAIAAVVDACSDSDLDVNEREEWVAKSEDITDLVEQARSKVEEALQASKLNPARKGSSVHTLEGRLRALTFAATQAQGLARGLLEAGELGKELPPNISAAVAAAGEVMSAYPTGKDLTQALDKAKIAQRYAAAELKEVDDTRMLALAGSVLVDVSRIVSEADPAANVDAPLSSVRDPQPRPIEVRSSTVEAPYSEARSEELIRKLSEEGWFVDTREGDEPK